MSEVAEVDAAASVGNRAVRSARRRRELAIHRLIPRAEDCLARCIIPRNHLVPLAAAEAVAMESTNVKDVNPAGFYTGCLQNILLIVYLPFDRFEADSC